MTGSPLRRLALAGTAAAVLVGAVVISGSVQADSRFPAPVPAAKCGVGSQPETGRQGRVPAADYSSGRAARGYTCNTRQVAHQGSTGGFKTIRYTDAAGHTCAFYDTQLLSTRGPGPAITGGLGVTVLDMSRPAKPVRTATLTSPAMLNAHESLLVNPRRGLLAATLGNAATAPGVLDLYDVRTDCRAPRLLSSTPAGVLGHETGWSHDGRTIYTASTIATLAAIDVSDPRAPRTIFLRSGVNYHGMRLLPDDRTLYAAHIGDASANLIVEDGGLTILDVGQIQDRRSDPAVPVLSEISWPEHSIPQVAEPFVRDGRRYVLEVDEFVDFVELDKFAEYPNTPVGAARIIDVQDPRRPRVVSNIRLAVHQPAARSGEESQDPGAASPFQGYAAHYCSLPTSVDPRLAACSMILSGLRVFDISDVRHPREVAYFNRPDVGSASAQPSGANALSAPAWDTRRGQIWYTDANSGFFNVRLTNGLAPLLR